MKPLEFSLSGSAVTAGLGEKVTKDALYGEVRSRAHALAEQFIAEGIAKGWNKVG